MSRYIDTDKIEPFLHRDEWGTPDECWRPESEFGKFIDVLSTADVVEVVRCKDCKHYYTELLHGDHECQVFDMLMNDDDYCSQGERREDGEIH